MIARCPTRTRANFACRNVDRRIAIESKQLCPVFDRRILWLNGLELCARRSSLANSSGPILLNDAVKGHTCSILVNMHATDLGNRRTIYTTGVVNHRSHASAIFLPTRIHLDRISKSYPTYRRTVYPPITRYVSTQKYGAKIVIWIAPLLAIAFGNIFARTPNI